METTIDVAAYEKKCLECDHLNQTVYDDVKIWSIHDSMEEDGIKKEERIQVLDQLIYMLEKVIYKRVSH